MSAAGVFVFESVAWAAGSGVSGAKLTCGKGSELDSEPPTGAAGVWGVWRSDVVAGTVGGAPKPASAPNEPPPAGMGVCSSPPAALQER